MEGAGGDLLGDGAAEEAREAIAELAGGLVGEGEHADAPRRHADGADEVGDAMDDDAGLAAAGARDDEQRTIDVLHGLLLRLVEALEETVCRHTLAV